MKARAWAPEEESRLRERYPTTSVFDLATMEDLRNHLFATIENLQDDDKPMPIDRAKAICEVADRLIDTAKVEVNMYRVVGGSPANSKFLPAIVPEEESKTTARPALMPSRVS